MFKRRTLTSALAVATLLVATSAMAQFADRTIKFTNGVNEDHPVGVGVKKMQEVLAAKTGGKMKINAFWGGSAGGDLPATQALRAGTQEMVCTSSSPLVGIVKELGAFDLPFLFANEKEGNVYSRYSNPNTSELIEKMCLLEGAEDGFATATGMASIFTTFGAFLKSGDHIVSSRSVFGSTHQLLTNVFS